MLTLGQRRRINFASEPPTMRLTEDASRSVVFIGHEVERDGATFFEAAATAFLLRFDRLIYLVTAAHVAHGLGDDPYFLRCNLKDGGAQLVHMDPLTAPERRWFCHPDPTVDIAVSIFPYALQENGWDHLCMGKSLHLDETDVVEKDIGPGVTCYAVGLFHLHQGQMKSVPVVHTGSIAAMPSEERLPIGDWRDPKGEKTVRAKAYLVEMTNLPGLSGSPVYIRPTIQIAAPRFHIEGEGDQAKPVTGRTAAISAPSADVALLGVWSGSWEARPGEIIARTVGKDARVPVGLGVVAPTSLLLELLRSKDVSARRADFISKMTNAAPETKPDPTA